MMEGTSNPNFKHGGAGAVKAIQHGEDFSGLPARMEQQVKAEVEAEGAAALIARDARRLETASRLYWDAFVAACQSGNAEKMTSYVKTWGWLANSALRAWLEVMKIEKQAAGGVTPGQVLDAIRKDNGNDEPNE